MRMISIANKLCKAYLQLCAGGWHSLSSDGRQHTGSREVLVFYTEPIKDVDAKIENVSLTDVSCIIRDGINGVRHGIMIRWNGKWKRMNLQKSSWSCNELKDKKQV